MSLQTNLILGEVRAELAHAQVSKGFDAQHDDQLDAGQLGRAAVAYIMLDPTFWPFGPGTYKPEARRDDLIRAAGFIVSEIARIDRARMRDGIGKKHDG